MRGARGGEMALSAAARRIISLRPDSKEKLRARLTLPIPIYVINLDRRPDRLERLDGALRKLGLDYARLAAVDGGAPDFSATTAGYARTGPLGAISNGALACSLSHAAAWRALLASDAERAVVLEDDVELSPSLPRFLEAFAASDAPIDLLKLERKRNERGLYVAPSNLHLADCEVARLYSLHAGSAAYVISRRGADIALWQFQAINLPLDHYLFNPGKGSVFHAIAPHQAFPALARQQPQIGGRSDVGARPGGGVRNKLRRLHYHARRTLYEAAPFADQILQRLKGGSRLRRVSFDSAQAAAE